MYRVTVIWRNCLGKRIRKQFVVLVFVIIVFSKVTRPLLSFKRISFETDSVYELIRSGLNPPNHSQTLWQEKVTQMIVFKFFICCWYIREKWLLHNIVFTMRCEFRGRNAIAPGCFPSAHSTTSVVFLNVNNTHTVVKLNSFLFLWENARHFRNNIV